MLYNSNKNVQRSGTLKQWIAILEAFIYCHFAQGDILRNTFCTGFTQISLFFLHFIQDEIAGKYATSL